MSSTLRGHADAALAGGWWRRSLLTDPAGAVLRVRETFVRGQPDTPKSEKSVRTLALGDRLASELYDHRGRSKFKGEDELVFCHPLTGTGPSGVSMLVFVYCAPGISN